MSATFGKFVEEVLLEMTYSAYETGFLRELRFAGGKYSDFARILQNNQGIESSLIQIANSIFEQKLKEPVTSVEVALSMIGFFPSRNILAASMLRGKGAKIVPGDPSLQRAIKFALSGEVEGTRRGLSVTDLYLGGLVFDILISILVEPDAEGNRPDELPFVEEVWKHGLQVAQVASQLAKRLVPSLTIEKDVCLDGILHDIGKLVLYPLTDSHQEKVTTTTTLPKLNSEANPEIAMSLQLLGIDSMEISDKPKPKNEKTGTLPDLNWLAEAEKFGFPHDVFGHMVLWRLGFLHDSSWIILYHHQPFLAARLGKVAQARATMIWLADHACRYKDYHRLARLNERILQRWFNACKNQLETKSYTEFGEAFAGLRF